MLRSFKRKVEKVTIGKIVEWSGGHVEFRECEMGDDEAAPFESVISPLQKFQGVAYGRLLYIEDLVYSL
jgi:hypothetical protein